MSRSLKCNMSQADRVVRFSIAILCFAFVAVEYRGFLAVSVLVFTFGLLNMASVATRFCPAYGLFNVSTNSRSILRPVLTRKVSRNFLLIVLCVIGLIGTVLVRSVEKERELHRVQLLDGAVRLVAVLAGDPGRRASPATVREGLRRLFNGPFMVRVWPNAEAFNSGALPHILIEQDLVVGPEVWRSWNSSQVGAGRDDIGGQPIRWVAQREESGRYTLVAAADSSLSTGSEGMPWNLIVGAAVLLWLSVWCSIFIERTLLVTIEEQNRVLIEKEVLRARDEARARVMEVQIARMQEFDSWKTKFTMLASHELRTPVATIQAACDLLLRHAAKLNEEQRADRVSKIQSQVDRLSGLLDDLLFFGRSGRETGHDWKEQDLCMSLNGLLTGFTGGEVEFASVEAPLIGEFDAGLIKRAVCKLLEYLFRDAQATGIVLNAQGSDDELMISFSDSVLRPDIVPLKEALESTRSETVGSTPELTLGLAVARIVVEVHHGRLEAESLDDQGTILRIVIPRTRKDRPASRSEEVEWRPS